MRNQFDDDWIIAMGKLLEDQRAWVVLQEDLSAEIVSVGEGCTDEDLVYWRARSESLKVELDRIMEEFLRLRG